MRLSVRRAPVIVEHTLSAGSSGDISSLHSSEKSKRVEIPSQNNEVIYRSESEPSDDSESSVSGVETSSSEGSVISGNSVISEGSVMSRDSGTEESDLDAMEAGKLVK